MQKKGTELRDKCLISLRVVPNSWDSSVGIVTRLQAGQETSLSSILGEDKTLFSFQCSFQTGPQAHIYPYSVDTCGYFRGLKLPEHKAGPSPPSNAKMSGPKPPIHYSDSGFSQLQLLHYICF